MLVKAQQQFGHTPEELADMRQRNDFRSNRVSEGADGDEDDENAPRFVAASA